MAKYRVSAAACDDVSEPTAGKVLEPPASNRSWHVSSCSRCVAKSTSFRLSRYQRDIRGRKGQGIADRAMHFTTGDGTNELANLATMQTADNRAFTPAAKT